MARIWRLQRSVYPALDGEGARRYGGRWNRPGRPVVYASEHLALCVLELLVHLDSDLVPDDYVAIELDLPDDCAPERVDESALPSGWGRTAVCPACQDLGDAWLEAATSVALAAPSAVLHGGTNVLLNPNHPRINRIRILRQEPFAFDPRLMDRGRGRRV